MTPKILQHRDGLSHKSLEIHTDLVVLGANRAALGLIPFGDTLKERMIARGYKSSADKPFVTDLPNARGTRVSCSLVDPSASAFTLLTLARQLVGAHDKPARLGIVCVDLPAALAERASEAVIAAALAAGFTMPDYRSKTEKLTALREIHVYGHQNQHGYARTRAEAAGNNLARFLTALPANELTPAKYRARAEKLAADSGWETTFWDIKKLHKRKAGAFLAVAQGSPEPDAGILHLRYRPRKKSRGAKALALVGKGICYDTGGTNLKTAKGMYGMHEDMEGSAVALGTLVALTQLQVDFPVDCWLALAQNHIGPRAYKPNEVVTAANGTTIEIVHTDAEGRMVLADTLVLASAQAPAMLIDYATLTGSCVHALSTRYTGAVTNRPDWVPAIIAAGAASGERVWPFPIDIDFEQELQSDLADIKQCTLGGEADHILAGVFLRKFITGDPAWVHLDLAAGNHKGGLAHIPTDVTGFGIRYTLNLLFDQKALSRA